MGDVGCAGAKQGAKNSARQNAIEGPGRNLNLILSASTLGELLPCGSCRTKAGGLGRRAGLIQSSRDTAGFVLVAEAGDLFDTGEPDPRLDQFLVDMLARLGYSVFGVGEEDLRRGERTLRKLVDDHPGLEWVSANIFDAKSGKHVFAPYTIRRAGSVRIGFTSCLEPVLWEKFAAGMPEVRVDPPELGIYEAVAEMRDQCDIIVGLLHMNELTLRALLSNMEGIDIAVAGHGKMVDNYPTRVEDALQVFFSGQRGRYVGWSNVEMLPEGPAVGKGEIVFMRDGLPADSTVIRDVEDFLETLEPRAAKRTHE